MQPGCLKVPLISLLSKDTRIIVKKGGVISIGDRVSSDGRTVMIADECAEIVIGDGVYFNEGIMISAKKGVSIGDGCQFGPNVKVFDNNHRFDCNGVRADHISERIAIGNNCWLASNVVVLKGAAIGDHCVIGAGCIIDRNIPANSIVKQNDHLMITPIRSGAQ